MPFVVCMIIAFFCYCMIIAIDPDYFDPNRPHSLDECVAIDSKAKRDFFDKYGLRTSMEFSRLASDIYYKISVRKDEEINNLVDEITEAMGIKPNYIMVTMGYLAKRGKIPSDGSLTTNSMNPFDTSYVFLNSTVGNSKNAYSPGKLAYARLGFMKWYDKTLRENGIEYKLMCINPIPRYDRGGGRPFYYPYNSRHWVQETYTADINSLYFWEPAHLMYPEIYKEYKY